MSLLLAPRSFLLILVDSFVSQNATTVDYVFGQYVGNGSTGLRNYVYSTSK